MRNVMVGFVLGVMTTAAIATGHAQAGRIVALNHVAIAVSDFEKSARFQGDVLGFPDAFTFREGGNPTMSYRQVSRNTFIELQAATRIALPVFHTSAWKWRTWTPSCRCYVLKARASRIQSFLRERVRRLRT